MTFLFGWLWFRHRHQTKDLRAFRVFCAAPNLGWLSSFGFFDLSFFMSFFIFVNDYRIKFKAEMNALLWSL